MDAKRIFTIGHSTHPIEEFLGLLSQHQISTVADVRSYPTSKRWPQFNQEELSRSLDGAGIEYQWLKSLGGRRSLKNADSPHIAWQIPAFRGYADYADTDDFRAGLNELIGLAEQKRVAYMCSEGLWWRCHRRIISDHLLVRDWAVRHIMPTGKLTGHTLPEFARVENGRLLYDGADSRSRAGGARG